LASPDGKGFSLASGAEATGYLHARYAESLSEFGKPTFLPHSQGWLLERPIPDEPYSDATFCYPLFVCRDWSALPSDIDGLDPHLVSVTIVTDPFAELAPSELRGCFDHFQHFKDHYIADLTQPDTTRSSRHHRYYARWAQRHGVSVECCDDPPALLEEWLALYEHLAVRHPIDGVRRFSPRAFRDQLSVPGILAFRATLGGETVAIQLWYRHQGRAYSHLQATSPTGYKTRAAYALYAFGLDRLAADCQVAALGAAAGHPGSGDDGLTAFKRGWATGTLPVYLCGRILDPAAYAHLTQQRPAGALDYFPAYRAGELV
jgi:GNAT acetyltransferase-like protein